MAKSTWLDLEAVGVVLGRSVGVNGQRGYACIDASGNHAEQISQLGFKQVEPTQQMPLTTGVYVNTSTPISPKQVGQVFGRAAVRQVELEDSAIAQRYQQALRLRLQVNAKEVLGEAEPIGMNYAGLVVYQTPKGRMFRMKDAKGREAPVFDSQTDQQGRRRRESMGAVFLYVDRPSDLERVTDGFVARILKGERLAHKDFERMISVSEAASSAYPISRRDFQESVEGSLMRAFARNVEKNPDPERCYRIAVRLYEGMPSQRERTGSSVANQQFSTPLPVSFVAQRLLGPTAGLSLLEPTIGNRSLVSALPASCRVYGMEIDSKRLHTFGKGVSGSDATLMIGDATTADFRSTFGEAGGFDRTIANPPFGALERVVRVPVSSPLIDGIETKRLDHLILLRTLAARKDQGRSVFIIGADHAIEDGEVRGRAKWLLSYLNDHYEVEAMTDVSGNLYQKMGAAFPIRMLVIGDRKKEPAHAFDVPDNLPVLRTHNELKEWADALLEARREVAPVALEADELALRSGHSSSADTAADAAPENVQQPPPDRVQPLDAPAPTEAEAVLDAAASEIDAVAEVATKDDYQMGYQPFASGDGTTMIPVNLASPVYAALAQIKGQHGEIDDYLAKELDYGVDDLKQLFSPEQRDATALAIEAKKNGRGFLLADQMGVGKGRVLAAMARHARLKGEVPVFVTVKPNLFSDFLERDLVDIGSHHLFQKPFIFNADAKIVDRTGAVRHQSGKPSDYKRCFESGSLPEDANIVFLTYSQLCRPEEKSKRSKLFLDISMKGNLSFLLDESHNGAGESNTSDNLCKAIINNTKPVLYSSGTPIKGAKNLRVYSQLLPRGVNYEELLKVVEKDPISLQEALNHEIALSGSLISRELDNRGVDKEFSISNAAERNRQLSDAVSAILMSMSYLSGDVRQIVNERWTEIRKELKELPEEDRLGSRMGVSSLNFGSRFHAISRQFLLAIKADQCVTEALEAIERGEKPIIALQHTGESLLQAAVMDAKAEAEDEAVMIAKEIVLARPVSFKDLLYRYVEKIQWVKEQGHYGDVSFRKIDSKESQDMIKHIEGLIHALPDDLSLTPIDYFKHRMAEHGYRVGEVSGRSLAVRYLDTGGVVVEPVNNTDKSKVNKVCREFNDGEIDAVVLTASGSTGISLQASPAQGKDLRPRVMIKWEPQQDIAVERQMDGRHNRTGQVVPPKYRVLLSGLPADDRLAMMFNNKNRSLTAATVANRDSKDLIKSVPDLLNEVGDAVAEQMFRENPKLAGMMDVEIPDEDEKERFQRPNNFYIGRMTGRIMLLPYDAQVSLYADLGRRFNERLEELTARGENPLEVKCYEWNAEVISREVFLGEEVDKKVKSQFDEPVYITKVKFPREMTPLRVDDVMKRIQHGRELLQQNMLVGADGSLREFKQAITGHYDQWLADSVSVYKYTSGKVSEALGAEESNETKRLKEKLDWLLPRVEHVAPGNILQLPDDSGEQVRYAVVGLRLPHIESVKRLGEWGVYAVRPGFDQVEHFSMNKLFVEKATVTGRVLANDPTTKKVFNESPSGKVDVVETLLNGNIFEAVAASLRSQLGRKIVYTDAEGMRQHGVLVKRGLSIERMKREVADRVRSSAEIMWYLDLQQRKGMNHVGLSTDQQGLPGAKDAIRVSRTTEGDYILTVPGTKAGGGHVYLDPKLARIEGKPVETGFDLDFEGTRASMRAYIKPTQIDPVLNYLMRDKNIWFYTNNKDLLNAARAEIRGHAENEPESSATR